MDARIFQHGIMGLKADLLTVPMESRFSYDEAENLFFLNLEGLSVTSAGQLEAIRAAIDDYLAAIGHKVYAIVNYDNVYIAPDVMDEYTEAVRSLARQISRQARRAPRRPAPPTRSSGARAVRQTAGVSRREPAPGAVQTR